MSYSYSLQVDMFNNSAFLVVQNDMKNNAQVYIIKYNKENKN